VIKRNADEMSISAPFRPVGGVEYELADIVFVAVVILKVPVFFAFFH
jgi:hypothetical protein